MNPPSDDIGLRLLFILHRGFVEVRLLAGAGKNNQVFDLADALELIPGMLKNWHDEDFEQVLLLLKTYQDKYPVGGFDFLARLRDHLPLAF
jgi:hypothetical protein